MQSRTEESKTREQEIQIKDLYEGAYLLCRGLELTDLTILGSNGSKLAIFKFTGKRVHRISEEYRRGSATVNVNLFKLMMNELKDRMFDKIRKIERKERECLDFQKQKKSKKKMTSNR